MVFRFWVLFFLIVFTGSVRASEDDLNSDTLHITIDQNKDFRPRVGVKVEDNLSSRKQRDKIESLQKDIAATLGVYNDLRVFTSRVGWTVADFKVSLNITDGFVYAKLENNYNSSSIWQRRYQLDRNLRNIIPITVDVLNSVYKEITYNKGFFDKRIALITKDIQNNKLAVFSPYNAKLEYLTDGSDKIIMSPFYHDNAIYYGSYKKGASQIYKKNLKDNRESIIKISLPPKYRDQAFFTPVFSKDGKYMVFIASYDGNSNIMLIDRETKEVRKISDGDNINVSPDFDNYDDTIVYASASYSRYPKIYSTDIYGKNTKRLFKGRGSYNNPRVSPVGDYISFIQIIGGEFHLGIFDRLLETERVLYSSYLVEDARWIDNEHIIFTYKESRYDKTSKLGIIDINSMKVRSIAFKKDIAQPMVF